MSEQPTPREGEVPVPDKGGWIDGETGPVYPVPAPVEPPPVEPTTRRTETPPDPPKPKKAA